MYKMVSFELSQKCDISLIPTQKGTANTADTKKRIQVGCSSSRDMFCLPFIWALGGSGAKQWVDG